MGVSRFGFCRGYSTIFKCFLYSIAISSLTFSLRCISSSNSYRLKAAIKGLSVGEIPSSGIEGLWITTGISVCRQKNLIALCSYPFVLRYSLKRSLLVFHASSKSSSVTFYISFITGLLCTASITQTTPGCKGWVLYMQHGDRRT